VIVDVTTPRFKKDDLACTCLQIVTPSVLLRWLLITLALPFIFPLLDTRLLTCRYALCLFPLLLLLRLLLLLGVRTNRTLAYIVLPTPYFLDSPHEIEKTHMSDQYIPFMLSSFLGW
jgi:hypothetical protein